MCEGFISKSEKETIRFGKRLGRILRRGDIVCLCGGLGSGKTVLAKGIAKALGVKSDKHVNSPSFVILKEYKGRMPLYHFDIYRLSDISQFSTVDYAEYFYGKGVSVIEWADKIMGLLPEEYLRIDLSLAGENERKICISAYGEKYKKRLMKFAHSS